MKLSNKIKFGIPTLMLGSFALFGACQNKDSPKNENTPQEKIIVDVPTVKNPTLRISYNTDTLENYSPILLYNQNGRIFRHYRKDDASYKMILYLFVHEAWHTHNLDLGYKIHKYSPQQYRKLLAHDEISANLTSLNSLIFEYSFSDNKQKFLKRFTKSNNMFSTYFKEVALGNIDPFSKDSVMIEKDLSLRINSVMDSWMARAYKSYADRQQRMVFNYIQLHGLFDEHNKNYQKMLHGMYNIGGIDFWKYAKKDININDVALINNLAKVQSFSKKNKTAIKEIKRYIPQIEKITNDEERFIALQHLIISSELKAKFIDNNYEVDYNLTSILYNKIRTSHINDDTFDEFAKSSMLFSKKFVYNNDYNKESHLNEFISAVYTINGIDLSKKINDFDAKDVPYRSDINLWSMMSNHADILKRETFDETLMTYVRVSKKTSSFSEKHEKQPHPRRSELQYIDIPNFWEPILIASTTEQIAELKKMYDKFENMSETKEFSEQKPLTKKQKRTSKHEKLR